MFEWLPIPMTLQEAIERLQQLADLDQFAQLSEKRVLAVTHHSFGQELRNEWGLWCGSPLAQWMYANYGLTHADDMSSVILLCLHRQLNHLPWLIDGEVAKYKQFWTEKGGMPKPIWLQWRSVPLTQQDQQFGTVTPAGPPSPSSDSLG